MRNSYWFGFLGLAYLATQVVAAPPVTTPPAHTDTTPRTAAPQNPAQPNHSVTGTAGEKVMAAMSFPASKLSGLTVKNMQDEKLGKVEDFVINLEDGKIAYVALSFGGVLGIGDKLFAVPFRELKFNHGRDEMYFVLNIDKDKLKAAPGFDKSHWPDTADPKWRSEIDSYYQTSNQAAANDARARQ